MKYISVPVGILSVNCYIVYDGNGVGAVIDPGDNARAILSTAQANGVRIDTMLLTHTHFDHVMAADEIRSHTGAKLLAPSADECTLHRALPGLCPPGYRPPEIDGFFQDGDKIMVGDMVFSVMHTPGHTPGSCCIVAEDLIFSGDTLFEGTIGRTDFPGGNMSEMMRSLSELSKMNDEYIVLPGHGGSTSIGRERLQNPYFKERSKK